MVEVDVSVIVRTFGRSLAQGTSVIPIVSVFSCSMAAKGHVPAPSHGLYDATTQPARVRRGSTGLKVVDNSPKVCANSLEFYIEANII